MSLLFSLPRELRDMIYSYYLWEESGYHHDFKSDTLRTSDGRRIDLALIYTCKVIATEMEGLAMKINTITFTTCRDSTTAERFEYMTTEQDLAMEYMIKRAHAFITPEIITEIAQRYPGNPKIQELQNKAPEEQRRELLKGFHGRNGPYVVHKNIVHDLLQLASAHPCFLEDTTRPWTQGWSSINDRHYTDGAQLRIVEWRPAPWSIPSESELSSMQKLLSSTPSIPWDYSGRERRTKHYYSATAAAIRFLGKIARKTRIQMRNIVLKEDHTAVVDPEAHARGLIPFCQENPKLRIERRVDLWISVLDKRLLWRLIFPNAIWAYAWFAYEPTTKSLHERIMSWIDEAMALCSFGMPAASFSIIFTGPKNSASDLWEGLKKIAATTDALHTMAQRGNRLPPFSDPMRLRYGHPDYVDSIRKIAQGNSVVRFDGACLGELWDTESVISALQDLQDLQDPQDPSLPEWWEQIFRIDDMDQPPGGFPAVLEHCVYDSEPE
ncbi:hypothetical protein K505DRAFT_364538 [Melanomma pulvis-pyrius CBS 109.77]|uniref:Uncharacterized protein n=1 Tax=Melanomma pulvis-pyrius CBS 109.77 TaxID=1314802 RepID=A0A6A6X3D9_9PLEO|nr:hypothetical protein K505DRAFT_364538 [Melanomma pulvis-pyrius CBS 109.77]